MILYPFKVFLNAVAIVFFLSGMLFFELLADFDYNPFSLGNSAYYIWDKLSLFLVICCIIFPVRRMKNQFYILMSMCFFRLLCQLPIVENWNQEQGSRVWLVIIALHFAASVAQLAAYAIMENDRTVMAKWHKKNISHNDDQFITENT